MKNAKTTSPSNEDSNKQRVDALDREHRETRALIQRLEASHETLGAERLRDSAPTSLEPATSRWKLKTR